MWEQNALRRHLLALTVKCELYFGAQKPTGPFYQSMRKFLKTVSTRASDWASEGVGEWENGSMGAL